MSARQCGEACGFTEKVVLAKVPKAVFHREMYHGEVLTYEAEILNLLRRLQQSRAMGLIFITHDLRLAFSMCDRVYVFYAGAVVEAARATDIEREPLHPYTHGLILSEPPIDRRLSTIDWLARAAFVAVLALVLAAQAIEYARAPHGQWDAWAIWNQKARFLLRGGPEDWRGMLSIAWANAGHPMLVSASVAPAH